MTQNKRQLKLKEAKLMKQLEVIRQEFIAFFYISNLIATWKLAL